MTKNLIFIFVCLFLFSCDPTKERELRSLLDVNQSLERAIEDLYKSNARMEHSIDKLIVNRGKRPKDDSIKIIVHKLRDKSVLLVKAIESIKEKLIEQTGGYNEDGSVKGFSDKIAYKDIKVFNDSILTFFSTYHTVSIDSVKIYLSSISDELPLSIQLLNLSSLEWRLSKLENNILKRMSIAYEEEDNYFPLNNIKVCVNPVSNVVKEGEFYRAGIFLTLIGNAKLIKDIKFENKSIAIDEKGIGRIAFVAKGEKFDKNGFCKKSYNGSITLGLANGRDTIYSFTKDYMVRKKCN